MNRIDEALIEKVYSPLVGWVEHRLGISQWRLSIECLNGSIAFYVAAVAFELATKGPEDGIFLTMLRALAWLLIMDGVRRRAYRQASSSMGVQTARLGEWLFRLVLTLMIPFSLSYADQWSGLFYALSLMLLTSHLYFKASDSPPPAPRGRFAYNRA